MSALNHPENEHCVAVERAAMWLSEQPDELSDKMLLLKNIFRLTPVQAARALTLARQFKTNRRAFG